jgi:uncharacterized protein
LIEWHEAKSEINLKKHGISFEEAATVFDNPLAEFLPDLAHSVEEDRYLAFGESDRGRMLTVAFTESGDTIRIISARESTPKEKRQYETKNPNP